MSKNKTKTCLLIVFGIVMISGPMASARTTLRNICRIKGQEENVLRGLGLVVGLAGTGEVNDPATMRALARSMEIMGSARPQTGVLPGAESLQELRRLKNAALVWVTAIVPATGARRGDKLDCKVSAINGKSLAGGTLAFAAMQGPNIKDHRVYALATGDIHLESPDQPLTGRIHNGCQMEEDVFTPFVEGGQITLILEKHHANFQTATDIVHVIRQTFYQQNHDQVQAVNAANIVISLPNAYQDDPVAFISEILELQTFSPEPEARVVINQRTGSIVIHGEIEIGDVVISHKNIVVEANEETPRFSQLSIEKEKSPKLKSLVDALNALKVPNEDAIQIIKDIDRSGKLHGRLIIY
ncbi:MAG: flagellar basal body P-ring protein FlgI [Planctomycetes bacterium]|nr:flagellar basal body P-ring protein FlgI [Planctomycetota bacterium]